eukprot:bmy_02478T0
MDKLVMEQFMMFLLQEFQVLVKESETIPEKGKLEDLQLKQKLEKGLMEDREETRKLKSQEPQLLKGPEREVLTRSGHKRDSQKSLRSSKRKQDNSSISQEVPQEGATYLDKGEFSGQLGSNSVLSPSTVGPTVRRSIVCEPSSLSHLYRCRPDGGSFIPTVLWWLVGKVHSHSPSRPGQEGCALRLSGNSTTNGQN